MVEPGLLLDTHQKSPTAAAKPQARSGDGEVDLTRIAIAVVRRTRWVVASGIAFAVAAAIIGLRSPHLYTADASFIPQGSRSNSSVSALAQQFGINVGTTDVGQSPQFYVDLLGTREILRAVVDSTYAIQTDSGPVRADLTRVLQMKAKTAAAREADAMQALMGMTSSSISIKTGVITLKVTSAYPDLSTQIVTRYLDEINRFNREGRQLRASAERRFTEQQLMEADTALRAAEDQLEGFLKTNRQFDSPALTLQQDRLRRQVAAKQQLYTALAQADEQARIEEVRDTPAITVIQPAVAPLHPNPRGTISRTAKSLVFGALLGVILALVLDFADRSDWRNSDLIREIQMTLRHPLGTSRPA